MIIYLRVCVSTQTNKTPSLTDTLTSFIVLPCPVQLYPLQNNPQLKSMYRNDPNKYKKRLNISSLNAAICNVAVFKSMKQRQFRDEIYISYSQQGVLLQANSQEQWQKANRYVQNFLTNKKISLLAFGFEKEVYEELIIKGLKDYTRRMKDMGQECPYINIIHYQKLRKSCEYMDKEHYIEPLKDWQRKNKKNPNFAFLIVQPIHKYEDVKRRLLEYLMKKEIPLSQTYVSPLYFLLLFFTSAIKEEVKESYEKTMIEITLEKTKDKNWRNENGDFQEYRVRLVNYSTLKLNQIDYKIVNSSKNLTRLGLEFIPAKEIDSQIKKVKQFLTGSAFSNKSQGVPTTQPFEIMQANLNQKYGSDYCIIPFKKTEKEKYHAVINKFINKTQEKNISELVQQIQKNIICGYDQIQILAEIYEANAVQRGYKIYKACLNDCPYMIHAYLHIPISQIDTFLLYLEQLKTYSCTYLIRFYGISIKYGRGIQGQIPADMSTEQKVEGYTYYLIFDYHHRTFQLMMENDMILDNFQIAQMVLQIVYLINFLHTHEEPRSLGELKIDELYWPMRVVLPYLKNNDDKALKKEEKKGALKGHYTAIGQGFQGDVKLAGLIMKVLLETGMESGKQAQNEDDHFSNILQMMLKESKYERITLAKCMSNLEELLVLN